jgi:SpoVK/Ycf46/Vps4 family AAA+-type ATPase
MDGAAVLSIDEFDSFSSRENVDHRYRDWYVSVLNALLTEIDGLSVDGKTLSGSGVIIIAACNSARHLDPALVRSGRLETRFDIQIPDETAIEGILRTCLDGSLPKSNLSDVAQLALGLSQADIAKVVRTAKAFARDLGRRLRVSDLSTCF